MQQVEAESAEKLVASRMLVVESAENINRGKVVKGRKNLQQDDDRCCRTVEVLRDASVGFDLAGRIFFRS